MNSKIIILFCMGVFFASMVLAEIPTFHQFYGTVYDENGIVVANDVEIKAYVNGVLFTTLTAVGGQYGYSELFLVEGAVNMDDITFVVDNRFGGDFIFQNEAITNLDLIFNLSAQMVCQDNDNDHYNSTGGSCGVVDCNDAVATINQGVSEACSNGIDDDCDGSIDEGCTTTPPSNPPGGGGGGGGTTTPSVGSFDVGVTELSVVVEQGGMAETQFVITNTGTTTLSFTFSTDLEDMIDISNGVEISTSSSETIKVYVSALANQSLDLTTGHIYLNSGGIRQEIPISIEVVSKDTLFDVVLTIPEESLYVPQGGLLTADISLMRMAESVSDEVQVTYTIKDEDDNEVFSLTEMVTVEATSEFVKTLTLPEDLAEGKYVLYAQVSYGGKVASSSDWFNVGGKSLLRKLGESIQPSLWWMIMSLILASIVVVGVIIAIHLKREGFGGGEVSTAMVKKQFS